MRKFADKSLAKRTIYYFEAIVIITKYKDKDLELIEHIIIKCGGDNQTELVEKAVLANWKQCNDCKLVLCQNCITEFQEFSLNQKKLLVCPGSHYGYKKHELKLSNIPVEDFLIIAKKNIDVIPSTGVLITRAFYINNFSSLKTSDIHEKLFFKQNQNSHSFFKAQQENWVSMGAVIVRRNRGKFITWERLSGY